MKLTVTLENLGINGKERRKLILRRTTIGTYDYGIYSKYALIRIQNRNPIGKFEKCVCGFISKYFDISMNDANDVNYAIKICKDKYNCTLEDWVNGALHKLGENYIERG